MLSLFLATAMGGPLVDPAVLDHHLARAHRKGMTGVAAVVVDVGGVRWAGAAGFADRAAGVSMTPDTPVRMGSITKVVTALAMMRLVQEGAVDLSDPVESVLPAFGHRSRFTPAPITLEMLGTHHSGLPSDLAAGRGDPTRAFTERTATLYREHLANPPGAVFAYSNLAVSLLGHALAAARVTSYEQAVQDGVFAPMEMDVGFAVGPELPPGTARPHDGGEPIEPMVIVDVPAGGLVASVEDLVPVAQLLLGVELGGFEAATVQAMVAPRPPSLLDLDETVGFGVFVEEGPHGRLIAHGGDTEGFHAELRVWPDAGIALVVATNEARSVGTLRTLARDLEASVLGPPQDPVPSSAPVGAVPLETGVWAGNAGIVELEVTDRGAWLLRNGKRVRLRAEGDGWVSRGRALRGATVGRMELPCEGCGPGWPARDVLVVRTAEGERRVLGQRMVPSPIGPPWSARLGTYEVAEPGLDGTLRLYDRAGGLAVEIELEVDGRPAGLRSALTVLDERRAVVPGVGRGLGEVLEIVPTEAGDGVRALGVVFGRDGAGEIVPPSRPPFTADQIRNAMRPGLGIDWQIDGLDGSMAMRWDVLEADADGMRLSTRVAGLEPDEATHTWTELVSHADFPAGTRRTDDVVIPTPMGARRTIRYDVVTGPDRQTYWFDPELPGAPVLHVAEKGGVEVFRMAQVHREGPP